MEIISGDIMIARAHSALGEFEKAEEIFVGIFSFECPKSYPRKCELEEQQLLSMVQYCRAQMRRRDDPKTFEALWTIASEPRFERIAAEHGPMPYAEYLGLQASIMSCMDRIDEMLSFQRQAWSVCKSNTFDLREQASQ